MAYHFNFVVLIVSNNVNVTNRKNVGIPNVTIYFFCQSGTRPAELRKKKLFCVLQVFLLEKIITVIKIIKILIISVSYEAPVAVFLYLSAEQISFNISGLVFRYEYSSVHDLLIFIFVTKMAFNTATLNCVFSLVHILFI